MKKIYCVIYSKYRNFNIYDKYRKLNIYGKYRKFKTPKISCIFEKILVLYITCNKCENKEGKVFKEQKSIEILKILNLIKIYNYCKSMFEESISQEFILKNIEETKNYFIIAIDQNEFMSYKHKKICTDINYIEHFLILISSVTGCVSISAFASLLGIPIGIMSSAIELKIHAITSGVKKCKSIIKK